MKKLRANSLFLVIVVAVVMALLSSSLILVAYYYRLQVQYGLRMKQLETNLDSGIAYLLAEKETLPDQVPTQVDLYGTQSDSIELQKLRWGIFECGIVASFSNRQRLEKVLMYGYKPSGTTNAALYLVDDGRILQLGGNTSLQGDCYVPMATIGKADLENQAYRGDAPGTTQIKASTATLPALDKKILQDVLDLFANPSDTVQFTRMFDPQADTITHSFRLKALLIRQHGPLTLQHKTYQGHIQFQSDTLITVKASAHLQDVILVAPRIVLEDDVRASLQAFALDSLFVGQHCNLTYPSVLGLLKRDFQPEQPRIMLGAGSTLEGILFTYREVDDVRQTFVQLAEGSQLTGAVYVDGYLEPRGTVYGGIICKRLIVNTPAATYENHLLNATIHASRRSVHFVGSALLPATSTKRLIKWLD